MVLPGQRKRLRIVEFLVRKGPEFEGIAKALLDWRKMRAPDTKPEIQEYRRRLAPSGFAGRKKHLCYVRLGQRVR